MLDDSRLRNRRRRATMSDPERSGLVRIVAINTEQLVTASDRALFRGRPMAGGSVPQFTWDPVTLVGRPPGPPTLARQRPGWFLLGVGVLGWLIALIVVVSLRILIAH